MEKIRVFIVDDHEMFREGVKMLLSKSPNFAIVGEASNGKICLEQMPLDIDVVLMDIQMPEINGVEATKLLLEKNPNFKIIALSMFGDEEYYYKMIHAGVKGFVLKESGSRELEAAINEVYNDKNYFSQELLRNVIMGFNESKQKGKTNVADSLQLSKREGEVLQNLCMGMSNKEIANALNISLRTVETHKSNLLEKTNSKNTIALVMYAIKNHLVEIR